MTDQQKQQVMEYLHKNRGLVSITPYNEVFARVKDKFSLQCSQSTFTRFLTTQQIKRKSKRFSNRISHIYASLTNKNFNYVIKVKCSHCNGQGYVLVNATDIQQTT